MKLVYVSHGDIPSRWAHTFQAMKMAEALAGRVRSLRVLTRGSVWPAPRVDLARWYGVREGLRVTRLPVHWRLREAFFEEVPSPRFDALAVAWCRLARPDLVYARSPRAGCRTALAGLDTVVELHGHPKGSAYQERSFALLREAAERPALRGIVTVTPYLRERYVEAGLPAEKILVWPDAVDPREFDGLPDRATAREQLGLPVERPRAVYCGHFYAEKGVPTLVDAARSLPEVDVALVGGWPRDVLLMRERAAGAANVRFEGFVPRSQVPLQLAAADVLVLPNSGASESARSTSPLKLFEYMAARRPIVASAIPALEGLLRDGENARVVPPDDPEALAAAVRELVRDRALAGRLAETARRDVRSLTWERRAAEILERFTGPEPAA